jgi:hypothetical protein
MIPGHELPKTTTPCITNYRNIPVRSRTPDQKLSPRAALIKSSRLVLKPVPPNIPMASPSRVPYSVTKNHVNAPKVATVSTVKIPAPARSAFVVGPIVFCCDDPVEGPLPALGSP